jgi:hypothetical protein
LTARILLVGLAAISASLALPGVQMQRTASDQAHSAVSEQTTRTAAGITDLFNAWRDVLQFFRPTLAVAHGQVWQNAPYISPDSQRWVVSNSTPIVVAGREVALLHFEANLDAVGTRVAAGLAPSMRARIIDTRTNQVIADTASGWRFVQAPLAKVGPWTDAAGPIRASDAAQVDPAVNGNRWVVEVSGPEPDPFTAGLLWRAAGLVLLVLLVLLALLALLAIAVVA